MHYLKCNNCEHFNEVKTEHMIFCSKCNKKLINNYSDWSKRNSDKTFDEYKELFCTTEPNEILIPKTKSNKTKVIKFVLGLAVSFVIFYAIGQFMGEKSTEPLLDKMLMEMASELNKSCPFIIDNETELENAVALPNNVFQYNYILRNMVKESVDINEIKNRLEPLIINAVKTSPDMKVLRDNKVTFNYYYKDKENIYLFTISVTPEQYE